MSKELADSIRRGSTGLQQIDGKYFVYNTQDKLIGVCALGAIIVDQDKKLVRHAYPEKEMFMAWFPDVDWFTYSRVCPDPIIHHLCYKPIALFSLIQHLNDAHRWTLEQIAEYVETLNR